MSTHKSFHHLLLSPICLPRNIRFTRRIRQMSLRNTLEESKPQFDQLNQWKITQTPNPQWKSESGQDHKIYKKISIDPYEEGRKPVDNYKTLISAIVPRPIGFISTVDKDGNRNLAPFSFFNLVNHDPPIFTIGFSKGSGQIKDTCRNILQTKELTINVISEWFVEAANCCSVNAPPDVDEWEISGLTPSESEKVAPPHVLESAFSIEATLIHSHEWMSKADPTKESGTLCIVEGVNFHVREDVINGDRNIIDISKLKPVSRLGGITYGRTVDGYEMPRPDFSTVKNS